MAQQHIEMVEGMQTGFSDAEGRAPSRWSSSGQSEQSAASRASQEGQELQNKPGLDSGERDPAALAASGLGARREEDEVGISNSGSTWLSKVAQHDLAVLAAAAASTDATRPLKGSTAAFPVPSR